MAIEATEWATLMLEGLDEIDPKQIIYAVEDATAAWSTRRFCLE